MPNSDRSRVREDRFYCPPALRRYNHQQQKQVQPQQHRVQPSNLDRFMKHTTPVVTAQHFPKTSMKGWRNQEIGYNPYFILADLWESLKEWSAYGVGVPLVLNESNPVIQYYVPYLSAIQLYVDPTTPFTKIRPGEESDLDSSRTTSSESDGSYEPRVEENNVDSISKNFNNLIPRGGDCYVGNVTEESEMRNAPGHLIYEYFEHALPYHRAPITDKISDLASKFPELKTCRSCDLTPSSWVSIAWYPIYRIPVGPSLQNLDASFLTFHSLSTPLKSIDGSSVTKVDEIGMPCQLTLPIFGLAVYKFKKSNWTQSGAHGTEIVNSLINSTENWLRRLNVCHPDFVFFKNRDFCL